jgi:hypothetical protein
MASAVGEEASSIEEARDGFERWNSALDTEFALFRGGDRSGAVQEAVGKNRDLRKSYEAVLAQAQQLADQAVDQHAGSFDHAMSRWLGIILAILAIALAGGCYVATWLVRSVIVPLNALANALGKG